MVVNEQEFRTFIANIENVLNNGQFIFDKPLVDVRVQINTYKQMLETPKPSKWKQLKFNKFS